MSNLPPFTRSIVRILVSTATGLQPVGMGCLVAPQRVCTCWHVVQAVVPNAEIGAEVILDFPLVAAGWQCRAQVMTLWPEQDCAVLEIAQVPVGVEPAPLLETPLRDLWGHPFRAFGCPPHFAAGVWASGVLRAPQAQGWVQLEDTKAAGLRLQPGFSGSPVWDEMLQSVVGLVVASDSGPKVALMLPAALAMVKPPMHSPPEPTNQTMRNPFSDLGGLTDPTRFFDREEVLRQVFEELGKGVSLALVGPSQIGKSSLLAHICALGPKRLARTAHGFVYLNMQWGLHTAPDFYAALCDALGLDKPLHGYALTRALRTRNSRTVVCLDELENLAGTGFTHEVRDHLRGLADGPHASLQLVTASRIPLGQLFADASGLTSPLDNICRQITVPPFEATTARAFLASRLDPLNMRFTETEIVYLLRESAGVPGRLQMLAYELFEKRWG